MSVLLLDNAEFENDPYTSNGTIPTTGEIVAPNRARES